MPAGPRNVTLPSSGPEKVWDDGSGNITPFTVPAADGATPLFTSTNPAFVTQQPSASLAGNTQAATASAVALASQACSEVTVQNSNASSGILLVGAAGGPTIELEPGQAFTFQVTNVSVVGIKLGAGVASATANWVSRS